MYGQASLYKNNETSGLIAYMTNETTYDGQECVYPEPIFILHSVSKTLSKGQLVTDKTYLNDMSDVLQSQIHHVVSTISKRDIVNNPAAHTKTIK
ncbi:hypothetical protein FKM82_006820 [Ascaphus truei]